MRVHASIPAEIDYTQFNWLRKGDRAIIAANSKMSIEMVKKVLKKKAFNIKILTEAMKLVGENKKELLTYQAQAQQLSQLVQMKAA